jgi:hypothetical protein
MLSTRRKRSGRMSRVEGRRVLGHRRGSHGGLLVECRIRTAKSGMQSR